MLSSPMPPGPNSKGSFQPFPVSSVSKARRNRKRKPTAGNVRTWNSAGYDHEKEPLPPQKRETDPETEHALLCQQKGGTTGENTRHRAETGVRG